MANAPAVSVLASRSVAKVSRPQVGRSIARERLFGLLDGWADRSLVWLAGPAGSGKTTLLGTYLEGGRTPVLWYQVDLRDADPATFFHFMSLAVARAAPSAAPMPSFTPEYAVGLQTYSRNFFEWLWAAFAVPPTLVFDNYQEAGDAGPFPELVRDAVLAAPSGGELSSPVGPRRNRPSPASVPSGGWPCSRGTTLGSPSRRRGEWPISSATRRFPPNGSPNGIG